MNLSKNRFSWSRLSSFKTTTTDPASKAIGSFGLRLSINIIQYSATRYLTEKDKLAKREPNCLLTNTNTYRSLYTGKYCFKDVTLIFSCSLKSYPKIVPTHSVLRQTHIAVISLIYRLTFLIKLIFIYLIGMAHFPFAVNLIYLYNNPSYISQFVIRGNLKICLDAFHVSDLILGAGIYF